MMIILPMKVKRKENIMKKLIIFTLTLMLIASLAIPAYAVTPSLKVPSITIPDISSNVKDNISEEIEDSETADSFWDNWFKEHPIKIDWTKVNINWG